MSDIIQKLVATGRMSHGIARKWFGKLSGQQKAQLETAATSREVSQAIDQIEIERKKPNAAVLDSQPDGSTEDG